MKVLHSWLKEYVGENLPNPEELKDLLIFHAFEVEDVSIIDNDAVLDVDVLPNRSSDCLSHLGIAREISALIKTPLKLDPFTDQSKALPLTKNVSLATIDSNICSRFAVLEMENITIKPVSYTHLTLPTIYSV